jgi:chromosome partitioning protein
MIRSHAKMNPCKTIAIFNHKGGVGKTTTAVNLAACLAANHGKRVLVVDMDPQANATRALLGQDVHEGANTIQAVLLGDGAGPRELSHVLVKTRVSGLSMAPADLSLSEVEFKLVSHMSRELVLRERLQTVVRSFDYIIIDCPPSLGLLALNSLAAADRVIVPCETQFLSLRGLGYVIDLVNLVHNRLNPNIKVLGVLPTKFYVLSRANNEALECVRKLKHVHVFRAVIPRDVKAEEAPSHGQPLIMYAPKARSTKQYEELTQEVIELCQEN